VKGKVESCFLLDGVVAGGISFLELLASEDEALLIGGESTTGPVSWV
jgi:hypothetical protein